MTDDPDGDRSRAAAFRARTEGAAVELPYAGLPTFLKTDPVDPERVGEAGADAAVLGVPYDGAVSNRPGARYGPRAIREASAWPAYLSGYKGGVTNVRTRETVDLGALGLVDCGDVPVFPMDRATTAESITAHVATVAAGGAAPVLLGGDHYCTFPAVRGFAAGAGHETVGLVQIDAHTDTVGESALFGEHFHGSSTHHVATSDVSDYAHVAQIGIRGYESPGLFEFAAETGLEIHTAGDVRERGAAAVATAAVEHAAAGTDAVYVTVDVDALDPSVAPGTGTPEPGGLTADEALTLAETVGAHDAVGAVDLMEVAPGHDPTGNTARTGTAALVALLERRFA
jgi:agmatinase